MRKKRVILIALLLIGLIACLFFPVSVVTIRADTGETIQQTIGKDERITLYFLHSYYHVPQYEYYRCRGNQLIMDEIRFGDLQAANYWNPYIRYSYDEETAFYYLKDIGYAMSRHIFSMAHSTEYSISIGEHTYDLNKTFPDAHCIITTVSMKPWIICLYRIISEVFYEDIR